MPDELDIYNNNIHSTTKYIPNVLFNTNEISIINNALINIKNSQEEYKTTNEHFKKLIILLKIKL